MLGLVIILLEMLSIFFLVVTVGLMIFILSKYFKTMEKPPFWVYMCGGFVLSVLYEILFFRYSQLPYSEVPLLIIKVMSYFMVFLGLLQLYSILRKTTKS